MICSDLHIHSIYSDGILTPKQIIDIADNKNLRYISVTDHDTIQAQYELINLNTDNVKSISGVEISTEYNEQEIHILGYFIDIYNINLIEILNSVRKARIDRIHNIIIALKKIGIDINDDDIEINKFMSVGRTHIARVLMEKGYVSTSKEAFCLFLAKGKPAYVDRDKINYKDALNIIRLSGGISILAHPGEIYKGINLEKLIKDLKVYGLNGIEVFHPSHLKQDTSKYYSLAKKYNITISGGSDYHRSISDNEMSLGSIGLDNNLMLKFLNYYKKIGG